MAVVTAGVTCAPAAGQQLSGESSDTVRVSVSSAGRQGNDISGRYGWPALDADGSIVAFDSIARTLVRDDTNRAADVFVRDQVAGTTRRVSVSTRGRQGNGDSQRPDVSGNGRLVVFDSSATNLVPGPTRTACWMSSCTTAAPAAPPW